MQGSMLGLEMNRGVTAQALIYFLCSDLLAKLRGRDSPQLTPAHHRSPDNRALGPERGELDAIFGILACT